ncbi:MAG: toll/interleukin-1 receptor domain-containing protein, partial [Oscillibacter sp.]|nr:toll/interleukin-1 receptor domain-containing protein [Oscillibacter sp.]
MEQRDFFISYTGADEAWAVWIAGVLKRNGYTAYVQALDIGPGDNFLEKMEDFVENSANFIAVWSKAYSESRFCMTEFRAAFHEWKEGRMECVLPVRVDGHPMKRLYSALVRLDLSDRGAASEKKLVDAVRYAVPHPVTPTVARPVVPQQDAETLYQMGDKYYFGNGVEKDYAKAREYYEQAAAKGHAEALFSLGVLYRKGQGVAQDYAKARECFEQAAAKGHAGALNNLGFLYRKGLGVAQDYAKARHCYEQAAAKGDVIALYNLGVLYDNGYGVAQDYAKARHCYEQAAAKGNVTALYNLAYLYEFGQGVSINYAKALE